MIVPLALGVMLLGLWLGYVLMRRRFLLRTWVLIVLILVAVTLLGFSGRLGAMLDGIGASDDTALVLFLAAFLIPPPLAAGVLVGGLAALFVRRHDKSA